MLIPDEDRKILKEYFEQKLSHPVKLVLASQHKSSLVLPVGNTCQWCQENENLVKELAELSPNISVELLDFITDEEQARAYKIDKIPGLAVIGQQDYGVRYYGIPAGYEFTSLVEDIGDVSRGETALSEGTKTKLKSLQTDVHLQVFVTPTCPYCPAAVRLAHQMAIESPHVTADMVEATEFPHLAQKYNVMGVPRVILNETLAFEGMLPESVFVLFVLKAAGQLSDKLAERIKQYER